MAINREAVLDATLALAEERGLDAVSMRAVAARLGVTPMALYRHVGDKQGLLDGLVERLLADQPVTDPDLPRRDRLHHHGAAPRPTARRRPEVFGPLLARRAVTPAARRTRDSVYQA